MARSAHVNIQYNGLRFIFPMFYILSYIYVIYSNQNYGFTFFDSTESSVSLLGLFSEKQYCCRPPASVLSIFTVFKSMNVFQSIVPVGQEFCTWSKDLVGTRFQLETFQSAYPKLPVNRNRRNWGKKTRDYELLCLEVAYQDFKHVFQ